MLARSVTRSLWCILLLSALSAALRLALPAGAAAEGAAPTPTPIPKPLVVLEPALNGQLAVTTTQAHFCLQVAALEKGGADSGPVVLEALQFLIEGGDESTGPLPQLSVEGCDAAGQARLELGSLKAQQVRPVYLSGDLERLGTYTALLFLWQGEGPASAYTLKVARAKPAAALTLATPEPPCWQTGWGLWNGAGGTLEFDLNVTDPGPVRLDPPAVIRLVRVVDGKVVDNLLGCASATAALEGEPGGVQGHRPLKLALGGLGPGEYHAAVRVTAPDGREVEGTTTAFIRHHGWLAVVVMALGILFAWLLQNWAGGGRNRALISRRLSYLTESLAESLAAAERLPEELGRQAASEAWQTLDKRLAQERRSAELEGGATELKAVYDDFKARTEFLLGGQDLAEEYDYTLTEQVAGGQMRLEEADQVRAQARRRVETLADQVTCLGKAALEAATSGAPYTLGLMRGRLQELRRSSYQARLEQVERDLRALGRDTPELKPSADKAIEDHVTRGARVKLAEDDYQATSQCLDAAQEVHADLRLRQIGMALADLAGQKPAGIDAGAWKPAAEAIQAVQDKLATLPAEADAEQTLAVWREAAALFTLAQVGVVQVSLGVTPLDLADAEWGKLRRAHCALDAALSQAAQALTAEPPNAEAGRRAYAVARAELAWLVRDLAAYRLRRLADDQGSRPEGIAATDAHWLALRVRAQAQLDALPERLIQPELAEAGLIPYRAQALDPLVERLELAEAALGDQPPGGNPAAWWRAVESLRAVLRTAQKHLADLHAAALLGANDLRARLERAEGSMATASARYDELLLIRSTVVEKADIWRWERRQALAALWAAPAWAEIGAVLRAGRDLGGTAVLSSQAARDSLKRTPDWWERVFGWMDALTLAIAFLLALAGGMATQYVGKATFGSWPDYVTVALWGFGVTQVTSAALGEVQKALYKKGSAG